MPKILKIICLAITASAAVVFGFFLAGNDNAFVSLLGFFLIIQAICATIFYINKAKKRKNKKDINSDSED